MISRQNFEVLNHHGTTSRIRGDAMSDYRARRNWSFPWATAVIAAVVALCASDAGLASGHGASHAADEAEADDAAATDGGIELGEFRIRSYYPVQAQKSIVRFVLHATAEEGRYVEMKRLIDSRRNKVRDQIITATRLVPLAEFDEAELKNFRRRIVLRLRRTLPELKIKDVYVSDFQLKVQSL